MGCTSSSGGSDDDVSLKSKFKRVGVTDIDQGLYDVEKIMKEFDDICETV